MKLQVGEKLALRQWKWDAEKLRQDVERDRAERLKVHGTAEKSGVSVFALAMKDGEDEDKVVERLVRHVLSLRNSAHYALATESELSAAGFTLLLDEPPDDHYVIPVGSEIDGATVEKLAETFGLDEKIRMPR